jgi:DNA-binding NarL/FixJ family response regulator
MPTRMTPRQREIAALVACGYTNAEIALALAISPNTIKKHLKDLFLALGLANRTELAVLVARAA